MPDKMMAKIGDIEVPKELAPHLSVLPATHVAAVGAKEQELLETFFGFPVRGL